MSAKAVRNQIGGDILIAMAANDEFPIGDISQVSHKMQEYFVSEGFGDILIELNYKWRPDSGYWEKHLCDVREYLRTEKRLFLEYKRERVDSVFRGEWAFMRKGDFEKIMQQERSGVLTRTETYNRRLEDAKQKWRLDEPYVRPALVADKTSA